jgi:hypothetical protein
MSSGRWRQETQEGTMPISSNDNRRNSKPDANDYTPRIAASEVSLNAIEIIRIN